VLPAMHAAPAPAAEARAAAGRAARKAGSTSCFGRAVMLQQQQLRQAAWQLLAVEAAGTACSGSSSLI
jgi:hypothetical protein